MSTGKFGRYEIKGELGRGGMATVYHAYDPRFERDVAIKVLPREFLHDPQFRARFEREAKMIALLEHPAIVPVYDFGEEEEQPYIVMRYMSGGSLAERLPKGALPLDEAVRLFSRLAPSLDAAHAKGIIHRDMKPGNILFDQYGNAFLSDFGIARLAQAGSGTLTGGNILGTPAYMSPEQVQGDKELDGRSDLYAMGVILYQVLTGNAPYQSTTPARVMMMHILEPVPQILTVRKDLPVGVQTVIERAMAKDPDQRYSTAGEMAAELENIVGMSTGPRPRVTPPVDAAGATMVSPSITQHYPDQRTPAPTPPPSSGLAATAIGAPPIAVEKAPAKAEKRSDVPGWAFGLLVLVVLGLVGAVSVGGFLLFGPKPTATSSVAIVQPTDTQAPVLPTNTPETATEAPTNTPENIIQPAEPTSNFTPEPSPTATNTPEPAVVTAPILGGADKIAFVSANDIWVVNVDGSDLKQITKDAAQKTRLQWIPNSNELVYISGKCIKTIDAETGKADIIACYNSSAVVNDFSVSPDGKMVAISLDNELLYVVPFDITKLKATKYRSDLTPLATCKVAPDQDKIMVKTVRWSPDSKVLSFVFVAPVNGVRVDQIKAVDISACTSPPTNLGVQFPDQWFKMKGYNSNPYILNFSWNGYSLYVLNGIVRNGGFGDLYVFNMDLKRLEKDKEINPIDNNCCYRDAQFSPDGDYLALAYQAISSVNKTFLYYIPYGSIGTGEKYQPLPLPDGFFPKRDESPQIALHPAQP